MTKAVTVMCVDLTDGMYNVMMFLKTVVMVVTAASSSKKQLNLSTPQNTAVGERSVVSSAKTRGASSQRGRGRRRRVTRQPQTPLSVRSTDNHQLLASAAGGSVASHTLAETSVLNDHCISHVAVCFIPRFGNCLLSMPL